MKGIVVTLLVVLLIGAGVFFFTMRKSAPPVLEMGNKGESGVAVKVPEPSASSLVSSFKEAMGLGQKMRCTYTAGDGAAVFTSTAYVEGKKFRSESEAGGVKMFVISDGEEQYVWNSGSSQGFKMSQACLESFKGDAAKTAPSTNPASTPEDYAAALESAQNVRCEAVTSADFSVPSDITFTDQCALMEQSKKMMEQYKDKIPAGMYPGQ